MLGQKYDFSFLLALVCSYVGTLVVGLSLPWYRYVYVYWYLLKGCHHMALHLTQAEMRLEMSWVAHK